MADGAKKTSPWVWVGIGCALVLVVAVISVVSLGFYGAKKLKQVSEEMKDPRAREAKVQKVLGCERIPAGYYGVVALSVPFVLDLAILSDKAPEPDGEVRGLGSRGFIYLKVLTAGRDQQELKDFFEGKTNDAGVLRRNNIRVNSRETIRRGTLQMGDERLLYLAQRGELNVHGGQRQGLTSLILIECPGDRRQRMGIWFGPDPSPDTPVAEADFSGTPADESTLREFMSHFHVCKAA
jgi:hypothetical protein